MRSPEKWIAKNMWVSPRMTGLRTKWDNQEPLQLDELKELKDDARRTRNLALVGTGLSFCILGIGIPSANNNDNLQLTVYSYVGYVGIMQAITVIAANMRQRIFNNLIRGTQEKPQAPLAK